jgi:hypothetical protein
MFKDRERLDADSIVEHGGHVHFERSGKLQKRSKNNRWQTREFVCGGHYLRYYTSGRILGAAADLREFNIEAGDRYHPRELTLISIEDDENMIFLRAANQVFARRPKSAAR